MQDNNLSVFVITRFGIGQKSKDFYDREFPYLENLLIKSILKQRQFITKWIILIDVNTPKYVSENLTKLIPKDLVCIYSHDIFSKGFIMPNIPEILNHLGVENNDKVVTIRVDADDMLSDDYVISVLNVVNSSDIKNNYELISVDATSGVYYYPTKNKLNRVFKKNYSIQALYSIFGKNFKSVHDGGGHGGLEKMVLNKGGYYCQLNNKDFWIRSMRQHSVSQLGKKFGILFGRFDFIKNIIKSLFFKSLKSKTLYKGRVSVSDLSNRFELSDKLISFFNKHEKNLERKKIVFSPMVEEIINSNKNKNKTAIQQIILDMYKKETDKDKRSKIKNEFYSF